jgi:hypothetical protein
MLTDKEARSAKAQNKPFKLADGGGLHLYVSTSGAKLWRVKYRFAGKEKLLSLGTFPTSRWTESESLRITAPHQPPTTLVRPRR